MKILAIDTSSRSVSCAILEDRLLLGECYANSGLTHSCTLMPMVQALLEQTTLSLDAIDAFAVTVGPGSFTGLRIGLSTVKGLAHALQKPCIPVSTLEALAWNLSSTDCIVAPVLDARCAQVYTALFAWESGFPKRLAPDEAISISELETRLKNLKKTIYLVGDGAELCYNTMSEDFAVALSSPALRYTRAASVALAALDAYGKGAVCTAEQLAPAYLRLPQAERELLAKKP